eukprot:CAMPEP_0181120114 /NCGR_PEP_ID=MMETSP1071-20121207/23972_1 /TAXON_ID=35127 /ORGANISM="Thalassiosira sp., Strain NH16" /LENGTH=386 /DNA_ID=CAMNT_0023204725 /DNA_START=17 /DNA_END=1177 /DNA_ORIENTATION=+
MSLAYFTPVPGLIGGSLIGLSAATLLLFNGDVLGASGLMSSFAVAPVRTMTEQSQQWKLAFFAAFCLTTRVYVTMIDKDALKDERLGYSSGLPIVSPLGFILGGFCVGFGTRLGNGCTTGHGICGMARMSTRSIVAVLCFMATGMISATGCSATCPFYPYLRDSFDSVARHLPTETTITIGTVIASLAAGAALPGLLRKAPQNATKVEQEEHDNDKRKIVPAIFSASFFSLGLVISKMTISSKIYGFLNVKGLGDGTWDPTLACVMGGGLVVSFISYQWVKSFAMFKNTNALECPLTQKPPIDHFNNVPTNKTIDNKLIIGEAIFGLGWGMAGLCPGPAMFLACAGYPNVLLRWWPSFFVGSFLAEKLKFFVVRMRVHPQVQSKKE